MRTDLGYALVYVANESPTDVYFDDINIEHRQGLQVQENSYDPFGLDLAGLSRSATPENKSTWNGKERQDEFGLSWHDHGARFYDPALGRWVVVDPDAEEGDQESWGTYQFGLDNAVRYNDLDGRKPGDPDPNKVGSVRPYQANAFQRISDGIAILSSMPGDAGRLGVIASTVYNAVNDAYGSASGLPKPLGNGRDGARTLEGHGLNRNEYQKAAFSTLMTLGSFAMTAPEAATAQTARSAGGGAARAAAHSEKWAEASLSKAIQRHAGKNASSWESASGKTIYENPSNGRQVVADNEGGYFRVFQPKSLGSSKGRYLDLMGNTPSQTMRVKGGGIKTLPIDNKSDIFQQATHFKIK